MTGSRLRALLVQLSAAGLQISREAALLEACRRLDEAAALAPGDALLPGAPKFGTPLA